MKSADLFLQCSTKEVLPDILYLAYQANTPVISTAIPCVKEYDRNSNSCKLIDFDNKEELLSNISNILSDENYKNTLTKNAKRRLDESSSSLIHEGKLSALLNHINN